MCEIIQEFIAKVGHLCFQTQEAKQNCYGLYRQEIVPF